MHSVGDPELRPLPLEKAISDAMLGIKGAGVVDEKQTVGGGDAAIEDPVRDLRSLLQADEWNLGGLL